MQDEINRIINILSNDLKDISPFLPKLSALLKSDIDSNFANKGRWDGKGTDLFSGGDFRWVPLSNLTKKMYKKKGYDLSPTLQRDTSGLRKTIDVKPSGKSIVFTANRAYAAIHQFGGRINIPPREGQSKWKAYKNTKGNSSYKFAKSNSKGKSILERRYKVKGYSINIPARPYFTLTPKDIELMVDDIANTIMGV